MFKVKTWKNNFKQSKLEIFKLYFILMFEKFYKKCFKDSENFLKVFEIYKLFIFGK